MPLLIDPHRTDLENPLWHVRVYFSTKASLPSHSTIEVAQLFLNFVVIGK